MKLQSLFLLFTVGIFFSCIDKDHNSPKNYLADIGDSVFNPSIDNPNFKFCDSSNVLHKRAYVKYNGGYKKFEADLIAEYKIKPEFKNFTGYFIVRFAVNCNDEIGRLRWEVLNNNFEETTCSKELEKQIIGSFRKINNWTHPIYRGKDYDGYTFIVIKIENGNIIPS